MKKINVLKWAVLLLMVPVLFSSCEDDDDSYPTGIYSDGVFVSNEGGFGAGNGSVSFYSYANDKLTNGIFNAVNGRALGDVIQSIKVHEGHAYMVANGSNKVEVVTNHDFKEAGVITGVVSPRYFVGINKNKGYVSQWGENGAVKVIDLATFEVTKSIAVGAGPENMVYTSGKLYVANSGGYGQANTISVIDPSSDEVINTITLDADNPKDLAVDANGKIWVLCYGYIVYDGWNIASQTPSKLVQIDPSSNTVLQTIKIGDTTHPSHIEVSKNGNTLFIGGGYGFQGIYKMKIDATSFPTTMLVDKNYYGFSVNSETGNIFAGEAPSFTAAGTLYRYKTDGTLLGSYEAGIGPNGMGAKRK